MDDLLNNSNEWGLGVDEPVPSLIGDEILARALDGDAEAIRLIFSRINHHVEPSEQIPESFLLYFALKATQLQRGDNKVLLATCKIPGTHRRSVHLDTVKMVDYLHTFKKMTIAASIKQVAVDTSKTQGTVKADYYQWPKGEVPCDEPPHEYVKGLTAWERINSEQHYRLAARNAGSRGRTATPYSINFITQAVFIDTERVQDK